MRLERKTGLITQIVVLILIGMIIISVLTFYTQYQLAVYTVTRQTEDMADQVSDEVIGAVREYPAYVWLLEYWYENAEEMDIEYDVDYRTGFKTEKKIDLLKERHPKLNLQYLSQNEVEAMPEEDQKLYAEVVYSWLTMRVNQIKRDHQIDFVFCVLTTAGNSEDAYKDQFFLFSGADEGTVRGTEYLEVYPIGVEVSVADNEDQQASMRDAVEGHDESAQDVFNNKPKEHLAIAGDYVDYYTYLMTIDDKAVLIGLTYNLSGLLDTVRMETIRGTGLSVLYQMILLIILLLVLYLFALRPLGDVAGSIRQYTVDKDSGAVRASLTDNLGKISGYAVRHNEIGQLTDDVIGMTAEIDDYIERIGTISKEKERIETELGLASRIQAAMMPSTFPAFPEQDEFDLYASMTPAREVGGDFYVFYQIDEDHLAIVIADVSGKGVPAALFMMVSKIILKNMIRNVKDPAKALELMNDEICANNREEMFVTVWLGVLEISTGKLTAANAGHEYPILQQADGRFELVKDKHGFVIGGMAGMKYQNYELQLTPGAKLFVYTDGVPEATNSGNELFGTDRMLDALNTCSGGTTPKEILQCIDESVAAFIGDAEQFDDLTMLCVEYKG